MSIHGQRKADAIFIIGRTFHVKDQIKSIGGRFVPKQKIWRLDNSDANWESVKNLCSELGGTFSDEDTKPKVPASLQRKAEHDLSIYDDTQPKRTLKTQNTDLTVSELLQNINQKITECFPLPLWVVGEIQNLSTTATGIFFNLAEGITGRDIAATNTLQCIIWNNQWRQILNLHKECEDCLEEGLMIRCQVQVQFYKGRGSITLMVNSIDPNYSKGQLALAREKLLKELRAQGLDQKNKSCDVSPFPLRVGLISADGSRAYGDFTDQLESYGYSGEILFYPTPMQGDACPLAIKTSLEKLTAQQPDLIVITRGGGSTADLRWFDSPDLAYAAASCPVAIIAAIGHHDDRSVLEEIAAVNCKTPTAAADFILGICQGTRQRLIELTSLLSQKLDIFINAVREQQRFLAAQLWNRAHLNLIEQQSNLHQLQSLCGEHMREALHWRQISLKKLSESLFQAAQTKIYQHNDRLHQLHTSLVKSDPTPWLKQGWTQFMKSGKPVKSIQSLSVGESLQALLKDGKLELDITKISRQERLTHGKQ